LNKRKFDPSDLLIYPILDDGFVEKSKILKIGEEILKSRIKIFQYRAKKTKLKDILELSRGLVDLSRKYKKIFILNDFVKIAKEVEADGVHIGKGDLPIEEARKILGEDKIIGFSTHNLEEAEKALNKGADYISFGPVFKTITKKDAYPVRGLKLLSEVVEKVTLPVVAIGGIRRDSLKEVLKIKVAGVSLISEIYKSNNISENLNQLVRLGEEIKRELGVL
jgi:thiamine-phosphate diphosphorylase